MTSEWDDVVGAYRADRERQRDLVLRHPSIAARLTRRPLDYQRPEQWTGYVPPYQWNGQVNDSPRRAALVEIVAAAQAAEKAEQRTPDEADMEVF